MPFFVLYDNLFFAAGMVSSVALVGIVHDVERVQAGKHGNGGPDGHIFHGRKGHNEVVLGAEVELHQLIRPQIHVVQKHGAQLEVGAVTEGALLLLLPLNAPNEALLAEDAVLGRHPLFNHVLNDAIVHESMHDAQAVLRLRMEQVVVQIPVQVQVQVQVQVRVQILHDSSKPTNSYTHFLCMNQTFV